MSISSIEVITSRIKTAEPNSGIAVFKVNNGFDACFDSTLETRRRIKNGIGNYIGTFNKDDDIEAIGLLLNTLQREFDNASMFR